MFQKLVSVKYAKNLAGIGFGRCRAVAYRCDYGTAEEERLNEFPRLRAINFVREAAIDLRDNYLHAFIRELL